MMKHVPPGHPLRFTQSRELSLKPSQQVTSFTDFHLDTAKKLFRKNLLSHYGCVNAIEFSNDGEILASAGDDRRVLIWDVHKTIHAQGTPVTMQAEHNSNVFVVAFDNKNTKLFSGGNDDQVIVHDLETLKPLDFFLHEEPVYGISIDPLNDNVFCTACDDGQLLIHDIRNPPNSAPFRLAGANSAFHAVMFNPVEPRLVVSANIKTGVALWDVRMPQLSLVEYGGKNSEQCCMSARFSQDGSKVLALRRRLPPILYGTHSTNHLFQFHHPGYYNSCTMKSCSFAGTNDQFVVSGSDNFDLCMWKIPTEAPLQSEARLIENAHLTLRGHRSIVNQVRFNSKYTIIASSGVEKVIKFWSPFSLPSLNTSGEFEIPSDYKRRIFSNNDYVNLILQSGQFLSLTYDMSHRTTREDPRMLAFFDALVQRDIDGMSDDEGEFSSLNQHSASLALHHEAFSPNEQSSELDEDEDNGNEENINYSPRNLPEVQSGNNNELEEENIEESNESDVAASTEESTLDNIHFQNIGESGGIEAVPGEVKPDSDRKENGSEDLKTSQASHSSRGDEDDHSTGVSVTNRKDGNIITQLITQKHDQLIRMAQNYTKMEAEGKSAKMKRNLTMLHRAKRMNRRKQSESMSFLRFSGPANPLASESSSSSTSSSETSSSTSSTSDSSDDNKNFLRLGNNIKPLLINSSNLSSGQRHSSSSGSEDEVISYAENAIRRRRLKRKFKDMKVPVPKSAKGKSDNEPCTSATALKRNGQCSALPSTSASAAREADECLADTSSSSCNDNDGNQPDSDHNNFLARLDDLSKRLKKVENRFNRRSQKSTMIQEELSSCSTPSSISSSSGSKTTSSSNYDSIVSKLPGPPKRMKISSSMINQNKTENSEPEFSKSALHQNSQEKTNDGNEKTSSASDSE